MENVLDKLRDNKNIPEIVSIFYEKCINNGIDNNLVVAMKQSPTETIEALSRMFEMAIGFTNVSSDELIKKTGFSISDMVPERLDASFAEIRAINYLGLNGFEKIELIHDKKSKYADMIAFRNEKKICFEVMCITNSGKIKWVEPQISDYVYYRLHDKNKIKQLTNTMTDYDCDFMNLIIVINTDACIALNGRADFIEVLKTLENKNQNDKLTYSIITGRVNAYTGEADDCIYPEKF